MNFRTQAVTVALTVATLSAFACTLKPIDGDTSASTDATGDGSATSPASASSTSAGSDAGSTSGGSSTTADPTQTATATATTTATTATATTTDSGTTTTTTGDATSTTGGAALCGVADGEYGDCQTPLGWAYNGTACQQRTGCDCGPDCELFHESASACAFACADAGECNEDELVGAGIAVDLELGGGCDGITTCGPEGDDFVAILEQYFPELLSCEPSGFCGGQRCELAAAVDIDPPLWRKLCAASLDPAIGTIECVIIGP